MCNISAISGLYNATKTLASCFCKMQVKILYWSPGGELIFLEHFRSLTDRIFQFKFLLWLSGLLNCTIDSDSFKSHTLNACKWPRWAKNKTFLTKEVLVEAGMNCRDLYILGRTNYIQWDDNVNSPWVDMSLHFDTLSWFWANQSLLFLLNVVLSLETVNSLWFDPSRVQTHDLPYLRLAHSLLHHWCGCQLSCLFYMPMLWYLSVFVF